MLSLIQVGSLLALSAVCGLLAYRLAISLYV
nr:photosystem I reaction center subunit M [Eustigmatophyceae sp. WTwin 8/9 T-6m6.8]UVI60956.1 photosystem I reaction center subunit M [Eustigmatophyceae sp. WTwin 8/9 T-6m6.8]